MQSCQLHIEAKRRIALVECRLTLDIVAEQEYHRHCRGENVQICRIASERCTFCRFEENSLENLETFTFGTMTVLVFVAFVHKLTLKCTSPPN